MNMWEAVTSTAGHGSDIPEIPGARTRGEHASEMSGRSESDRNNLTVLHTWTLRKKYYMQHNSIGWNGSANCHETVKYIKSEIHTCTTDAADEDKYLKVCWQKQQCDEYGGSSYYHCKFEIRIPLAYMEHVEIISPQWQRRFESNKYTTLKEADNQISNFS